MDKHYIGLAINERRLQAFSSNQTAEEVLKDSGYDFVSGPYDTIKQAREEADQFAAVMVNVTYLNRG